MKYPIGDKALNYASLAAAAVVAALAVRHQLTLFNYILWQDEAETIVAAKLLADGQRLYAEVFNHHGPLTFLGGYLIELVRSSGIYAHRMFIALMQWGAILSVALSPLLRDQPIYARSAFGAGFALFVIGYLPESFAHTVTYQAMCGMLIAVVLAQYTLPAIVRPEGLSSVRVAAGNFLIACLPFLVITYFLPFVALWIASFRLRWARPAMLGLAAGAVANILFLAWIGSIPGFLVQQIYLNAEIMPNYARIDLGLFLQNAFETITKDITAVAIFAWVLFGLIMLARREAGDWPWRWLFVGLALASFLTRGFFTHELPYLYGAATLPLVLFERRVSSSLPATVAVAAIALLAAVKLSMILPADVRRISSHQLPSDTEFAALARELTEPGDRIIAYTFSNIDYIMAKRLPASGQFFYFPWQVDLEKNPVLGIELNACADIRNEMPKVMRIDQWKVWGLHSWEDYGQCIQALADTHYTKVEGKPFYIRKDVAETMRPDPDVSRP